MCIVEFDTADYQPHYEMVGYRREGYRQGQENVLTTAEIQRSTEHCSAGIYGDVMMISFLMADLRTVRNHNFTLH